MTTQTLTAEIEPAGYVAASSIDTSGRVNRTETVVPAPAGVHHMPVYTQQQVDALVARAYGRGLVDRLQHSVRGRS